LKSGKVRLFGDLVAADVDETVSATLLAVLVDKTTAVDVGHLAVVKSRDFLELTLSLDATILRQEERNAVVAVELNLGGPSGSLECVWVTPGVVVESEKVGTLVISTAVHVRGHFISVFRNVGSGVANWNGTHTTAGTVLLHVTSDSLDVWSAVGSGVIVDDLVSREEEKGIRVAGKCVHGGEDALEVYGVVGWGRSSTVNGIVWSVDIEGQVDTGICEGGHARIVVGSVVNSVNSYGVDSQLLELCNVTHACARIGKRVDRFG